ncbi:PITH domain-domain-containing protein [Microdochium bolleyi]|uniref:PITH domain-domain-containing protein n=1 Tax=Microdochium bolleyi TaxID=196109 RepID=A0A136J2W3_9PEZI|nr:PITH domain-domain-containing protein [Microdochium bolleyi]
MSKTITISSRDQFSELLKSSSIVVADFYADWCGPCKQIAPFFEQLSRQLSQPGVATFVKINTETEAGKQVSAEYRITSLPTFILFRNGSVVEQVRGSNPQQLQAVVQQLASDIENVGQSGNGASGSGSGGLAWRGAELPRGYTDLTDVVNTPGLDWSNVDESLFNKKTLYNREKPSALGQGKGTASDTKDWIESDTDEQIMLYVPFNATVKLHTLQITSLPPTEAEDDEDEDDLPVRPKTIKIFTNRPHILDFSEAEDTQATQEIELSEKDWNKDGTANIGLRFVRFQNITSVVIFVVDGDGDSDKVRLDRIRLIGETGEKREMGKLEKIGDEPGE